LRRYYAARNAAVLTRGGGGSVGAGGSGGGSVGVGVGVDDVGSGSGGGGSGGGGNETTQHDKPTKKHKRGSGGGGSVGAGGSGGGSVDDVGGGGGSSGNESTRHGDVERDACVLVRGSGGGNGTTQHDNRTKKHKRGGGSELPRCMPLDWEDAEHLAAVAALGPFDVILATDVVFTARLVDPLLRCIEVRRYQHQIRRQLYSFGVLGVGTFIRSCSDLTCQHPTHRLVIRYHSMPTRYDAFLPSMTPVFIVGDAKRL